MTNCNLNAFYSVVSEAEETIQVVADEGGKKPDPRSLAQQFAKIRFSTNRSPPDDTLKKTMERNEKAESWCDVRLKRKSHLARLIKSCSGWVKRLFR
jgi:hypothetical protein